MYRRKLINAHASKGFTLIEMAIVILIFGIVIAGASRGYDYYLRTQKIETTNANVETASDSVGQFRAVTGRYPCPARLDLPASDENYGREDCSDMTDINPGTCEEGICISQSVRSFDYFDPFRGTQDDQPPRIRIGALPFRNLNMEEKASFDGYANRIMYVVTEHLAFGNSFQADGGGIEIQNDEGSTALTEAGTAHFLVFSSGENGVGAYKRNGEQSPCPTGVNATLESENCDLDFEAVYTQVQESGSASAEKYDDVMTFFTQRELPMWQLSTSPLPEHRTDIHAKVSGNVGFGYPTDTVLEEEFQVASTVRAKDDPHTDDGKPETTDDIEGNLHVEKLCDGSNNIDCMASELIAGEIGEGEGDISCPAGQFMTGIAGGQAICEEEIIIRCPEEGQYIRSFYYGWPDCTNRPAERCPDQDVDFLCPDTSETITKTLGSVQHLTTDPNKQYTVTAGYGGSLSKSYECQADGTWLLVDEDNDGHCACQEDFSQGETTKSCGKSANSTCGNEFTGNKYFQSQYICTDGVGQWVNTLLRDDECACDPTSRRDYNKDCPAGFNTGAIFGYQQMNCDTLSCDPYVVDEDASNCACTPVTKNKTKNCNNNTGKTYTETRLFVCPGGSGSPGHWEDPFNDYDTACACEGGPMEPRNNDCPTGYVRNSDGLGRVVLRERRCTANGVEICFGDPATCGGEVIDYCVPAPAPTCVWVATQSHGTAGTSSRVINQGCLCGSTEDGPKICTDGNTLFSCNCQ